MILFIKNDVSLSLKQYDEAFALELLSMTPKIQQVGLYGWYAQCKNMSLVQSKITRAFSIVFI